MTEEFHGRGSFERILSFAKGKNFERIFLVTGRGSFQSSGAQQKIEDYFTDKAYHRFSAFCANPQFDDVIKGAFAFKQSEADAIMAIGGGSVVDMAKLINAAAHHPENFAEIITQGIPLSHQGVPLLLAPTTSGSGSECTHFAAVYIAKQKYSLAHDFLYPIALAIDPNLSDSMSPKLTATTGFDALSQATESYWACAATPESRIYATKAIQLILPNIVNAVNAPTPETRAAMAQGSYWAGKAINISKTTIAHALSYHLTTQYHVPHGHAVAIILGKCFKANANSEGSFESRAMSRNLPKIMKEIYALYSCVTPEECESLWFHLMEQCHLSTSPVDIGINSEKKLEIFANSVNPERLANHPVRLTTLDIMNLFVIE